MGIIIMLLITRIREDWKLHNVHTHTYYVHTKQKAMAP